MALNTTGLNQAYLRRQGGTANQTDIANLNYAQSKGWSYQAPQSPTPPQNAPQGSQAINGAQYNTQALQQANFSNIQPVGNTLYGVPKVATSLTSDQLTGGTPSVPSTTMQNQTSPEGIVAGATQYMTQLQNDYAAQQAQQQALETRLTAGQTSANDLLAQIGQKGTEYQSELEKYNYTANVGQLQDINRQIASKTAEFQNAITAQEGRVASASSIYGRQALLQRQQASEVGGLSAIAQALQGNITLAQNTAKDAINVKYEPMENQLKQQLQQIEFLYNDLSRADQKKANSQTALLNERLRVMEEQKTVENNISNIVLTAAQKGADMNTLNSIRNAKTLDEAILVASGATPILTPAGLAGLTENDIMRVGNKIYKKGKNWLAPEEEAGTWSIETDAAGNPYRFNATTGQSLNLDGTPRITDNNVNVTGATAKSIANAIKQVESGGNYNASGASGENGAYQFMPSTWESWSREYAREALGVDTPLSMSKSNQDFVAEFKIQQWLDQGLTPQQIAAKWNSGSEVGWENKVGVNSKGVKYDVPGYVSKVIGALSSQAGVSITNNNVADSYAKLIQSGQLKLENVPTEDRQATAQILATMTNPKDTANDLIAKEKAQLSLDLKKSSGLSTAVGPLGISRITMPWQVAAKQDFIAGVEQLVSGLSLEALIQAKAQGATFGALSDSEMKILASSATKIGTWALRDKNGNIKGYKASQESFKKELDTINKILLRGITGNLENNNPDPLGLGIQAANSTNPLGI